MSQSIGLAGFLANLHLNIGTTIDGDVVGADSACGDMLG